MTGLIVSAAVLVVVVIVVFSSTKVLRGDEHGVVYRLGRPLPPPKGPGLVLIVLFVDRMVRVRDAKAAEALLDDWTNAVRRFTEVMPRDYKLVLAAKEKAEAEGLSDDETATRMMEALHG